MTYHQDEIRRQHDKALANVRKLRKQANQLRSQGLWKDAEKLDRRANELARRVLDMVEDMHPGQDWW